MTVQVVLNTPLAEALGNAIQPKLLEVGWGSGSADDAALAEYIILMLVNGRNQDQIATELSSDLLNLGPDDPGAKAFAGWLFEQAELLNAQLNGSLPTEPEPTGAMSQDDSTVGDFDTDMGASGDVPELNAPTGPRSMRNGTGHSIRGAGRDKRLLGQMTKAMDRTSDSVLHRVRGNDRINSHARGPPSGPRGGIGRPSRGMNGRGANIQAGLNAMAGMGGPGMPGMNAMNGNWGMPAGQQPNQMDLYAMLEQQSRMMEQLSQQMLNNGGGGGGGGFNQQRPGKSLFDRVQNPRGRGNFRGGQQHRNDRSGSTNNEPTAEGEDVDMSQKREAPNPDETICKYNLHCTNRECKFAHQSPAAPPGITIDTSDVCTFGAACKNKKCVGRHPSPAARLAHQSEQDCKFYPNCTNPRCPFRHPAMPVCRNGPDCTTANCKFTHVKTKCKFNPCLNPNCAFVHEDGQQGGFKDKVWTAGSNEHVSERKFVDDNAENEVIIPEGDSAMGQDQSAAQDIVT